MSSRYNIGGSATINGIIMINSSTGKMARAVRNPDGNISVKESKIFNKLMGFYKTKIEMLVRRIPAVREIIKMLLMFIVVLSSLFLGMLENYSLKKRWSIKKVAFLPFFIVGIYVFVFENDVYSLAFLGVVALLFYREVATILRYHGAEHKCINMYESTDEIEELSEDNAKAYSRIHLRCGTNIVVLLIPLSLIYYFLIEPYVLSMFAGDFIDFVASLLLIGIGIELFRLFQRPIMQWLLKPGIIIQRFVTTKEPNERQLEVALCALKAVL